MVFIITACSISNCDEANEEVFKGVLAESNMQPKAVPVVDAASAVVLEVESGRVIFSKNAEVERSIASTTKIMTAIVAIENGNLEDEVTISKRAANIGGSNINLQAGDKYSLKELLYGLLLNSGNDASIAIAEHIGGTVENFVEMMNEKARKLGAYNTSYANTHGLDASGHFSTAYDLALIARYALRNETFATIVGTKSTAIKGRSLYNTNELLELYEGADGVKTGYTGKAGRCLVATAVRNDMRLISVVLGSPTTYKRASASKAILDYGFNNYKKEVLLTEGKEITSVPVYRGTSKLVSIRASQGLVLPLREDELERLEMRMYLPQQLDAPVYAGSDAGWLEYVLDGNKLARIELKLWNSIRKKSFGDYFMDVLGSWLELAHERK